MSITIFCPSCSRSYKISETNIGKKVVCSNKDCGTKFIAALPPSDETSEIQPVEYDFSDGEADTKISIPANIVQMPEPVSETPQTATGTCRFKMLARLFIYCGLLLLVASAICPMTVNRRTVEPGGLSSPEGGVFNMSLAMTKLSAGLLGMTFTISGSALWLGSKSGPSLIDGLIVIGIVVLMLGWMILNVIRSIG